jgi:dynein heavy chain, axonemal
MWKKNHAHVSICDGPRHARQAILQRHIAFVREVLAVCSERLPLNNNIITEGRAEEWLNDVEAAMFAACKTTLYTVLEIAKATKKEKWVKENQGQCIISAGQIIWTMECEKALSDAETAKKSVRQLKKKWVSYLNKLTGITRSKLNKIERNKTVSLITIEVHARDVLDKLSKSGCNAVTDFEWISQLRFYWDKESDDCVVRQVLSVFKYGYEYQVRLLLLF